MHRFANPTRFLKLGRAVLPWSAGAAILLFAAGLYLALAASPADYQQGETVRIMYVHVPAAWMALFVYGLLAAASAASLIWRHGTADVFAKAASPLGAAFTALALVTGSLWGQPMWGTWWVWDARLTSTAFLFVTYIGYLAVRRLGGSLRQRARRSSVLALLALFFGQRMAKDYAGAAVIAAYFAVALLGLA